MASQEEPIYLDLRFAYGGTIEAKTMIIVHSICLFLFTSVIIYKMARRQISLNTFVNMKSSIVLYLVGEMITLCSVLTLDHGSMAFRLCVIIHNMAETFISFNMLYPFINVIKYARYYLIVWFIFTLASVLLFEPISMQFFTGFMTVFGDIFIGLSGVTLFFRSNNCMVKFFGLFSVIHYIAALILFTYIANNWDNGVYWSIHSYYQIFYIYFLINFSTKSDKELKSIGFIFDDGSSDKKLTLDKDYSDTEASDNDNVNDEEQGILNAPSQGQSQFDTDGKDVETNYNRGGIFASNKMSKCSHFCKLFLPLFFGYLIFTFALAAFLGNATWQTPILNENEYYWPGPNGLLDERS